MDSVSNTTNTSNKKTTFFAGGEVEAVTPSNLAQQERPYAFDVTGRGITLNASPVYCRTHK